MDCGHNAARAKDGGNEGFLSGDAIMGVLALAVKMLDEVSIKSQSLWRIKTLHKEPN